MVLVHRLDGTPFYLNAELMETVEATPDTVIVLVNGHRYIVSESTEEVISRVLSYRRFICSKVYAPRSEPYPDMEADR